LGWTDLDPIEGYTGGGWARRALNSSQRPATGEFNGRQITESRVDAFAIIDIIQEAAQLLVRIGEVLIVRQIDLLFFDGANKPFGVRVLFGFADRGHADLHPQRLQPGHVVGCGVLDALVGVMHLGLVSGQAALQGRAGEALVQAAAQLPAPDLTREHIHEHRQVDKVALKPDVSNIPDPDLIRVIDDQVQYQVREARNPP